MLEKVTLFHITSSCCLFFVCLCHWADQSLDSFTGSITCESVWKFWLITGAYLSGEWQERELIETGEPELTIRRLCESSAKYKDVKEGEEMEFKNHARLLGDAWFSKTQILLPLCSRLSHLNKVAKQAHNFTYDKWPHLHWDDSCPCSCSNTLQVVSQLSVKWSRYCMLSFEIPKLWR